MTKRPERGAEPSLRGRLGRHVGYGLTWALSTLAFMFLGWLVDDWVGTLPLFTVVGAMFGAAAGLINLYYRVIVAPRERESKEEDD